MVDYYNEIINHMYFFLKFYFLVYHTFSYVEYDFKFSIQLREITGNQYKCVHLCKA